MPFASTLRHIVVEAAHEVASIRIFPVTLNHLALLVLANKLLACLEEDVSALTLFLAVCPLTRVDVLIGVVHHTFTMTLSVVPVAVVRTNIAVSLLANAALKVVLPAAAISVGCLFGTRGNSVDVITITIANLNIKKKLSTHCPNIFMCFALLFASILETEDDYQNKSTVMN